ATPARSTPSSHASARTAGDASGRDDALLRAGDGVGGGGGGGAAVVAAAPSRLFAAAAIASGASAATGAGAAVVVAVPSSISIRIRSDPTASICPTSPPSASTLPATGDGISTDALSVITSARPWSSAID